MDETSNQMKKPTAFVLAPKSDALSGVPKHSDIAGLTRFLFLGSSLDARSPLHIAVHVVTEEVTKATKAGRHYAEADIHDFDEVNVVWGDGNIGTLVYRLEVDGVEQIVQSPATIVIPAGVVHRAEAISGRGLFFCILLKKQKN